MLGWNGKHSLWIIPICPEKEEEEKEKPLINFAIDWIWKISRNKNGWKKFEMPRPLGLFGTKLNDIFELE